MKLKDIVLKIDVWQVWLTNYKKFVPKFIDEAKSGKHWQDWDQEIFYEFFERSNDQCVSSLRQGYFTKTEKENIKNNWTTIAPLFQKVANSQDAPLWDVYTEIQNNIRSFTDLNRKAATYRLIAGLQPNLLSTVVNEVSLREIHSHLKNRTTEEVFDLTYDWFRDSYEVCQLYKNSLSDYDPIDLITYPWQTKVFFEEDSEEANDMSETNNLISESIDLLKYKKQIILQGPPGTGKTKLAKEIASLLIKENLPLRQKPNTISNKDIEKYICIGTKFYGVHDRAQYEVNEVTSNNVKSKVGEKIYGLNFNEIIKWYNNKRWSIPGEQKNQLDPYGAAIAKYIYENIELVECSLQTSEQFKLIQFHPSYNYEDFVRGIVAKPNETGEGIFYKAENKILGKLAKEAYDNFLDSKKQPETINKEEWLRQIIGCFQQFLEEKLIKNETTWLTDVAYITRVTNETIRYQGDNWSIDGGVPYEDLMKMFFADCSTLKDVRDLESLTLSAKSNPTYWLKMLDLFRVYYNGHKSSLPSLEKASPVKVGVKNYVLVIDEINRANLSSVLGELIYALEYRGEVVDSMYDIEGDTTLVLPPNLYIIGTMNTADRSVGHLDYAIRRRFAFIDILPKDLSKDLEGKFNGELFEQVSRLFNHNSNLSQEFDPKDVQLGHSYFIDKTDEGASMSSRLKYEIKPILFEYVKDGILIGDDIVQKIENLR